MSPAAGGQREPWPQGCGRAGRRRQAVRLSVSCEVQGALSCRGRTFARWPLRLGSTGCKLYMSGWPLVPPSKRGLWPPILILLLEPTRSPGSANEQTAVLSGLRSPRQGAGLYNQTCRAASAPSLPDLSPQPDQARSSCISVWGVSPCQSALSVLYLLIIN